MLGLLRSLLLLVLLVTPATPGLTQQGAPLRTPDARFAGLPDYPFRPHFVDVPWGTGRVRMHYVDEGPRGAEPILLLHGQPSWSFMFRHVIAGLVAKGHRVIAPDMIGYGRSDKPRSMDDYSYERHLRALQAFVERTNFRDATLVLHDWGGLLGLPTLRAMPNRFARVALFNTSLNDGSDPETPQFKAGFDRWIELLRTAPIVEIDKVIAAQAGTALKPDVARAYMAPYPDGSYQSGVRRMSALIPRTPAYPRARENGEVRRWLGTWRKPVLIAFSEDSDRLHPGQFALFNRLFARDAIWAATKIPGTKHFLFEDRPQDVVALLHAFASGQAPPAAPPRPPTGAVPAALRGERLQADVAAYAAFGDQRTGSLASRKTLDWLEQRLRTAGFTTSRTPLPVTHHRIDQAALEVGTLRIADGVPLWPVVWTPAAGLRAPLRLLDKGPAGGSILVVRLPYSVYASIYDPRYRELIGRVRAAQPAAAILITDHPTGEAVALNVMEGRGEVAGFPMLVVGQRHAGALEAAASRGESARLTLTGASTEATDFNLIAERGDQASPALIVSTPKNGWFTSGGERGPGIAMALGLADWIAAEHPQMPVRMVFTSHHELGGAGIRSALADTRFAPERVRAWIHLGANIATLEPRVENGQLVRENGPNARRGMTARGNLLELGRRHFAAIPGFAVEDLAAGGAVGEITVIARGREHPAAGLVGYQLLHHTRLDTAETTSGAVLEPVAHALARMIGDLSR